MKRARIFKVEVSTVLWGVKCLRKKLVYIAVIIAITFLGIALSYYFTNLMTSPKTAERQATTTIAVITTIIPTSITSTSASALTAVSAVKACYVSSLKFIVLSITESRYVSLYLAQP
jgi:hypothetical protein